MKKIFLQGVFLLYLLLHGAMIESLSQQQRFPMPEFKTGYVPPETERPAPRACGLGYLDLGVLVVVLGVAAWVVFKKRSRRYILYLSIFSLAYFGFYRQGCICSVGAVQNLALAIFYENHAIPLVALAFFIVPLVVALFAGRIFCGSACPLGTIQDLVIVKPVKVAPWLQQVLGLFPFIYLGLAVLYAATGTDFIICRYDPFVGIFRMGAEFNLVLLGIFFLLLGMFVARPYCRFVCPYAPLLGIMSRFSKNHLSITPDNCVNCKLCKDACPFGAIEYPNQEAPAGKKDNIRFIAYLLVLPLVMFVAGWAVSSSYKTLSMAHPDVSLARLMASNPDIINQPGNLDVETFLASGRTFDELLQGAGAIEDRFRRGGWYLGAFIGLVVMIMLINQLIYPRRTIYEPNTADCLSCARCMDYCPVGKPNHPYNLENRVAETGETSKNQIT